jgi:hypothetical protein
MAPQFQVQIPAYTYNTPPIDIGSGYAQGIASAGKSIAGAISGVMGGVDASGQYQPGILEQSNTSRDMLSTLNQMKNPDGSKVLPDDIYQSTIGKSLGAQQSLVGLYAGQYIENQAAARQVALEQGKGAVDVQTAHQKLLDTYQMIKTGGTAGAAATGVKPGQMAIDQSATQPATQPATNLAPQLGPPGHTALPAGAKFGQMKDPKTGNIVKGWQMPDGSFMPM